MWSASSARSAVIVAHAVGNQAPERERLCDAVSTVSAGPQYPRVARIGQHRRDAGRAAGDRTAPDRWTGNAGEPRVQLPDTRGEAGARLGDVRAVLLDRGRLP